LVLPDKISILIVDDDVSILNAFRRIFERKGYLVTVAEKGVEAIEKLKEGRFDVALIDFGLPDMEGTALFSIIEQSSHGAVKIMLTGKTQLKDCVKGADAFLGKPVNPEKLLSIIDNKLKHKDIENSQL
jgi:DNA-binding NtrC family response regulator